MKNANLAPTLAKIDCLRDKLARVAEQYERNLMPPSAKYWQGQADIAARLHRALNKERLPNHKQLPQIIADIQHLAGTCDALAGYINRSPEGAAYWAERAEFLGTLALAAQQRLARLSKAKDIRSLKPIN